MLIERLDPADDAVLRGCHAAHLSIRDADDPLGPPEPYGAFVADLTTAWGDTPGEAWAVFDEPAGSVIGYYRINLPDKENLDSAFVYPNVHPAHRRRGIGSALLRHAAGRATAGGRSILRTKALAGTAGAAFAAYAGATAGLVSVRRALDVTKIRDGLIAQRHGEASAAATGYTLVNWLDATPPEYLEGLVGVLNAFADAPSDEGFEREFWDVDRVREQFDLVTRYGVLRRYSVAAVHASSGEMAGLTQVFASPESPEWAFQGLTAVGRAHRGHRIGLLVKCAMLEWLAVAEPTVERILTDNADVNSYMIAVNEMLGFEVLAPAWQSYQLPVSDVR